MFDSTTADYEAARRRQRLKPALFCYRPSVTIPLLLFSGLNCINNLTFYLFEVEKRHLFAEIRATLLYRILVYRRSRQATDDAEISNNIYKTLLNVLSYIFHIFL